MDSTTKGRLAYGVLGLVLALGVGYRAGVYWVGLDSKPTVRTSPTTTDTHIFTDEHLCIVRQGDFVISTFTDGTLCYGKRHEPVCRRAVPFHTPEAL